MMLPQSHCFAVLAHFSSNWANMTIWKIMTLHLITAEALHTSLYPIEGCKYPALTLSGLSIQRGVGHNAIPSHHFAVLSHFSSKMDQKDGHMNWMAPHHFRGVPSFFQYSIERQQGTVSTLLELSSGVQINMLSQLQHVAALAISVYSWAKMTAV